MGRSRRPEASAAKKLVVIVAAPGTQILDVCGPAEVFAQANRFAPVAKYVIECRSVQGRTVDTSCGLALQLPAFDHDRARIDTLLLGGGTEEGLRAAAEDQRFTRWLRMQAQRARRIGSVCTGAFLLAAAGLLDGRRATTHWGSCETLSRMFPAVEVDDDAIFTQDGNVYTSAGITAGIDLALHLVEADLGHEVAAQIARNLVLYLRRPGGQGQFSSALRAQSLPTDRLRGTLDWVLANLSRDLGVAKLSERAGMSERNFARVFAAETGTTPAKFVARERLEHARLLLVDSDAPLERIASRCGFRSADVLRRAFIARFGVTPGEYRRRFG